MKEELSKEIESIIKKENLNCSIDEFQDKVDCYWISKNQKLSEKFIEKFQPYITKFKRKLRHGKSFWGTKKTPIERAFFINDKLYGEQNKYENR